MTKENVKLVRRTGQGFVHGTEHPRLEAEKVTVAVAASPGGCSFSWWEPWVFAQSGRLLVIQLHLDPLVVENPLCWGIWGLHPQDIRDKSPG